MKKGTIGCFALLAVVMIYSASRLSLGPDREIYSANANCKDYKLSFQPHESKQVPFIEQTRAKYLNRHGFIPYAAIAAGSAQFLEHTTPSTCHKHYQQGQWHGYAFDSNMMTCWLVNSPLHASANLPAKCVSWNATINVLVKPDEIDHILLQSLLAFQESADPFRRLTNPADLRAVVDFCRSESNQITVLIADSSQESYLRIWLHYYYQVVGAFDNVIVIAQDVPLYQVVERLLPQHVLLHTFPSTPNASNVSTIGSNTFMRKVQRRYYQLALLSAADVHVLYSDVDVMLFCNPIPEFVACAHMRAPFDNAPSDLCSGFIFLPAGDPDAKRVLLLADAVMHTGNLDFVGNQNYLNLAVAALPNTVLPLSDTRFPTAKRNASWDRVAKLGIDRAMAGKCYLHNNWAKPPLKEARVRQHNLMENAVPDHHPGFATS
eukprot:TRINITY_DN10858_c0_g2_i1.p1 TRINITY_DN10858_c0_g2~~TRINITY_DN10858_c0_g2_i1.p1  ORF type:complete len:434 (+),score=77.54 TRINITY_DN10858_c0_g2_i1:124-1425(+)